MVGCRVADCLLIVEPSHGVLTSRRKFENERLNTEDVEMEDLNFYYADYSRYVSSALPLIRKNDNKEGS